MALQIATLSPSCLEMLTPKQCRHFPCSPVTWLSRLPHLPLRYLDYSSLRWITLKYANSMLIYLFQDVVVLHSLRAGSGSHAASCVTGALAYTPFSRGREAEREDDHSPHLVSRLRTGSYTSTTPHMPSRRANGTAWLSFFIFRLLPIRCACAETTGSVVVNLYTHSN